MKNTLALSIDLSLYEFNDGWQVGFSLINTPHTFPNNCFAVI